MPRLQTNHSKTAYALQLNASSFVAHHGVEHCGFLTLTFADRLFPTPASKRFHKALKILSRYFHDYIWTTGLGRNGRVHYHVLVACSQNIREGIDLSAYTTLHALDQGFFHTPSALSVAEQKAALRKVLSNNPALKLLRRSLYPALHKLGFGHQCDLSPVYTTGEAVASYLKLNYVETVQRKSHHFHGMRLTGYKQGGHRPLTFPFAWTSQRRGRLSYQTIASALGVTQYEQMKPTFGPRWGYYANLLINDLQAEHGRDPRRWPVEEIVRLAEERMPRVGSVQCQDVEDITDIAITDDIHPIAA